VRRPDEVIFADELGDETTLTYSREAPGGWEGHRGRIDRRLIEASGLATGTVFICGSNGFVETASRLAMEAGFNAASIRTERFGPTG
jgi:ferredoxin-NADP reductase